MMMMGSHVHVKESLRRRAELSRRLQRIELLEDRVTPAILYVSPSGIDGPNRGFSPDAPFRSLQVAANVANSGDEIRVAGGNYTYNPAADEKGASLGTTQVLTVFQETLTFLGGYDAGFTKRNPAATPSIIDGQNTHRGVLAISITTEVGLTMDGFILENGFARGISLREGGEAFAAYGGGIFVDNGGARNSNTPFVFRNLTFRNNVARGENTNIESGGAANGGGLHARVTNNLTLENLVFENNIAQGGDGAVRGGAGLGGAIQLAGTNVTATNITFINNSGRGGFSNGVGIGADGERADGIGGALALGPNPLPEGARPSNGVFSRVTATGNSLRGGDTASTTAGFGGGGFGGAFFAEGSSLTMTDVVATGNTIQGGSGFTGGIANGGALQSTESTIILNRVNFSRNTIRSGDTNAGAQSGPVGGGAIQFTQFRTPSTRFTLNNALISDNSIAHGVGGTNNGGGGGGVAIQGISGDIAHTTFVNNRMGPGLFVGEALVIISDNSTPSTVGIANSIVSNHTSVPSGRAVFIRAGNTLNINGLMYTGNTINDNFGEQPTGGPFDPGVFNGYNTVTTVRDILYTSPGAPNFDYSLTAASPAVDTTPSNLLPVDIGNNARPGRSDFGAFELGTGGNAVAGSSASGGLASNPASPPPPPAPLPPPLLPPGTSAPVRNYFATGVGAGAASVVTVYNPDGSVRFTVDAFPGFTGGIRVASGDFNGDGVGDVIAGTGPGTRAFVRVFNGVNSQELFSFFPFENFTGGVFVSAGDLNADGKDDFVVSPDEGGGPRLRVFNGVTFTQIADFFGINDPAFRGGARAALADLNGDGRADLLVSAGFGGGPRVAGFDGLSLNGGNQVNLFSDFFAFEQELRNGVYIAGADINGDGFAELVAGAGPGGGPRVRALSGSALISNNLTNVADYFAGDVNNRGGIRVVGARLDADNFVDLVTGPGDGGGSTVNLYSATAIAGNGNPGTLRGIDPLPGFGNGIFVG